MLSLQRLQRRLPLVMFISVLVFAVLVFGFACALMTDHPGQVIDRVLSAVAALPAIVEVWSLLAVGSAAAAVVASRQPLFAAARASPPVLQRFLF
jgi:ACR3 family arsenite efflux pump ArsB